MAIAASRRPLVGRPATLAPALACAMVLLAAPARAEEQPEWHLSGFGTVGVVSQTGADGWAFVRNNSQSAARSESSTTPDSRLGVQLNWSHGPRWDAALQAVAVDKPSGTPLSENIEWAYLGFRPLADTRVRFGRASPDIFLFADSRNVGYALPWARPPVDFYGFAPIASVDGIDVEQRWTAADAQFRLRATAGSYSTTGGEVLTQRIPLHGRNTFALGLTREDGGLMLKASFMRVHMRVGAADGVLQLRDGLSQLAALPVPGLADSIVPLQRNLWTEGLNRYVSLGAQYDRGPWTVIVEGSDLAVPDSALDGRRGYVSLGYRYRSVGYYAVASRVSPKRQAASVPDLQTSLTPVIGAQAAAGAQQLADFAGATAVLYRYDQRMLGVGLRWDCTSTTALKLQVDRFHVHPYGAAGWQRADAREVRGTLVSVVFDFVWGQ